MRLASLLGVVAVLVGCSSTVHAQSVRPAPSCSLPHTPGIQERQIISGQRQRSYRLFIPPGYDGRTRVPLVLDLHGSGGTAAGQARNSGFEGMASREGFAVASLQADGGRWNVPVQANRTNDVAYVSDVIDDVARVLCTDNARIYATGFSGGGRMSSLLGCMLNTRIAAIAPVSGLRWPAPCGGRPIPVLTFHGLADPQNPYAGQAEGRGGEWMESVPTALAGWAQHNACNADVIVDDPPGPLSTMHYANCRDNAEVRMIRVDGLGHAWTREEVDTTEVIWQFFKSHPLR